MERIYVVSGGERERLVLAKSQAAAVRWCVKDRYVAKAASAGDVARLMGEGVVLDRVTEQGEE